MSLADLTGRVALVTGGSRGLGREICRGFAQAGADVIVVSRKLDACELLAEELRTEYGVKAVAIDCHVGRWDSIGALVERAYAEFPAIDVLVNNAGMSPAYDIESAVSEELFDKVVGINFKGPFRLMSLVGERMVADRRPGSIINVSSMAAVNPQGPSLPYAAAKGALNTLTIAFARRLGPTVRVNGIMCGPFFTDVSKHWDMDAFNAQVARHALQRGGQPEEIVGTALYLAGDASSFTTGAIIPVNGGEA
jgi:NAD(P)-dependent dehydrogenase (short-subunit alcohol dehydrogenase family)